VSPDLSIVVGIFPGFSWIRCVGKGSFLNSPEIKAFGDERIAAGETLLVIDLETCSGMDSTFMGTMAGLASRISAKSGSLHVASPGARNRQSLEDLGLDFMMDIDPPSAPWRSNLQKIRSSLMPQSKPSSLPSLERARHVLDAHTTLSRVNDANARTFDTVLKTLEQQVLSKPGSDNASR
jgi:anti-sigma B factor antagonist